MKKSRQAGEKEGREGRREEGRETERNRARVKERMNRIVLIRCLAGTGLVDMYYSWLSIQPPFFGKNNSRLPLRNLPLRLVVKVGLQPISPACLLFMNIS